MAPLIVSVIGALNADLIMTTNRVPDAGESMRADEYREALGGKGANAAIATYRTCHKRLGGGGVDSEVAEELPQLPGAEDIKNSLKDPMREAEDEEISVKMIGAVGADKYSDLFFNELKKNGVDTTGVRIIQEQRSPVCFVMVEKFSGENRCLFTMGATGDWKVEDFTKVTDLAAGEKPDLVIAQMEIHKDVVQQMIETAGKAGIDFILNAAPADPITSSSYRFVTHLLVNESEAAIMSGRDLDEVNQATWSKVAQEFLDLGVKYVVITLGGKGAYYATATERNHVPAYKVKVVDSTGAGDTFTGAYASSYLQRNSAGSWDIKSAVIRANKAAAMTIGKFGAQAGIPWADEIDQFEAETNVILLSELDSEKQTSADTEKKGTGDSNTIRPGG